MNRQQRRMVSIVRAIKAGKWTDQPPEWAGTIPDGEIDAGYSKCFINADDYSKACLVAEAFTVLLLAEDSSFDVPAFVRACGFTR